MKIAIMSLILCMTSFAGVTVPEGQTFVGESQVSVQSNTVQLKIYGEAAAKLYRELDVTESFLDEGQESVKAGVNIKCTKKVGSIFTIDSETFETKPVTTFCCEMMFQTDGTSNRVNVPIE